MMVRKMAQHIFSFLSLCVDCVYGVLCTFVICDLVCMLMFCMRKKSFFAVYSPKKFIIIVVVMCVLLLVSCVYS